MYNLRNGEAPFFQSLYPGFDFIEIHVGSEIVGIYYDPVASNYAFLPDLLCLPLLTVNRESDTVYQLVEVLFDIGVSATVPVFGPVGSINRSEVVLSLP